MNLSHKSEFQSGISVNIYSLHHKTPLTSFPKALMNDQFYQQNFVELAAISEKPTVYQFEIPVFSGAYKMMNDKALPTMDVIDCLHLSDAMTAFHSAKKETHRSTSVMDIHNMAIAAARMGAENYLRQYYTLDNLSVPLYGISPQNKEKPAASCQFLVDKNASTDDIRTSVAELLHSDNADTDFYPSRVLPTILDGFTSNEEFLLGRRINPITTAFHHPLRTYVVIAGLTERKPV